MDNTSMKLVAIYNVWDDWDMATHSIKHLLGWFDKTDDRFIKPDYRKSLVDGIIIIASSKSNYGEYSEIPQDCIDVKNQCFECGIELFIREPQFSHPMNSETDKRNFGLQKARELGYTHFITMDADEFYNPEDFKKAKEIFHVKPELQGLVCGLQCYFGKPTLTIGIEKTLVPFIHKLTPTIKHEFNRLYPFAWEGRDIRIDPTRSLNINSGVEWSDIIMHHYSWCRTDYQKKVRNSTARANIERSTILEDLENAQPGYFCKYYQKTLHQVPDYFGLGNLF